jgi:diacylglycerol kinase family enzyme
MSSRESDMAQVPWIVNRNARGCAPEVIGRTQRAFADAGLTVDLQLLPGAELEAAVREAAHSSHLVAVGGGDGTQSAAAAALVGTGVTLVPVPVGTLNHFARRLGIDSIEAAVRAIIDGRPMRLPVGSVNGRAFVNAVSIGLYPRFVRTRERLRPRVGYRIANVAAAVHSLWRLRQVALEIEACGIRRRRVVAGVWFGLGRGSFRLPDDAEPIAARALEAVIAPGRSRVGLVLDAFRTLGTLRRGEPPHRAELETLHAPVVKLHAPGLLDLARDGEAERVTPPVTVMVLEGALEVLSLEPIRAADPPVHCPDQVPGEISLPAV